MAAILYSKLAGASDVTSPTLGTGGAEVGSPTYVAGYLHNGILSDANNEGCTFPTAGNSINLDKGSIRFYAKMNFDHTDVDTHYLFDFYDAGNGGIRFYFNPAVHNFTLEAWEGGVKRQSATTSAMTWSIGDIIRFDLLWDRGGADIRGNETLGIFMDNVLQASSIWTWNTDTVNANLYIGIDKDGNDHSDVVINELKTWGYDIFIGNYWKEVAPRLDGGVHIYDLCRYNGKLYGTYDGVNTKLVEWNEVDAWVKRAATGDIQCLKVFRGKLYGGGRFNGKIYYWNDVDAWIEEADLGTCSIYEFVELNGQLYCGTSIGSFQGGCLWKRGSGGNWTQVAPRYDVYSQYIQSLCTHWVEDEYGVLREEIFAGTGYYGKLLMWNGVDGWIVVADANAQGLGNVYINDLLSYEDVQWDGSAFVKVWRLLAVGSGIDKGFLWEWNGGSQWNVLVITHPSIGEIHDLLLYQGDPILAVCHSTPSSLLVMWDGAHSWLPLTTNSPGVYSDAIEILNGKVYAGTYNYGQLWEWVPDVPDISSSLLCCGLASTGVGGACIPAFISTSTPYFSAIFTDPGEDDIATHYRLRVNTVPDMSGTDLWDSGQTAMANLSSGQRCANITYDGLTLSTNVTYYWKIAFYDQDGILGSWSPVNCFRIGAGGVPHSLLCEQKTNPTDVTDTHPEFSAIYP